ncbi:hypothetical protein pdam_00003117 [Pocillopora damicornis]|uniref:Exosome complex component 10 n=1 Tax=Pocillopora damicornis TaxID=46731 RepID=A0A3M6T9L7_POCDA|nr:exosome component 10-like [Pocillopora damicornis]RMX38072.1 hypothetical protein pdam_00003117 [Pocillopora damicornis]
MADHMEEDDAESVLPGIGDLKSFSQESLAAIVQAVRESGNLPGAGEDHDFYYSFPDFREFRSAQGARLLSNIGNLLHHWKVHCQWPSDTHAIDPDSDELIDSLVEANDVLLERVDTNLDEAAGLKSDKTNQTVAGAPGQQGTPIVSSWNRAKKDIPGKKDTNFRFLMAKHIQRPQLKFKDKIDNSNTPFIPIIKRKPNALRPLEVDETSSSRHLPGDAQVPSAISDFVHQERVKGISSSSANSTAHPYQYELEVFQPPENQLMQHKEELYDELEKTPFTLIETTEQLHELCQHLATVTEFAVDLEAHSYRSFQGFCCLMQISTRHQDFLIDTLELRSELQILNDYFTSPGILKVFHGADMDIGWLQRDFGIYVVNMFDTGQAARVLNYGKYSLAFLLKKFCDVTANKQYQLADWRIRPLPSEMVHYAREDTHYLLYICDRLHNELIKHGNVNNNLLQSVYSRSRDICLKRYEKPLFTSESYRKVLEKHKRTFNPVQMHAFRLLFTWRDNMAREEDESYGFVIPNHMMFQISETLPREAQGVLACCNPVPTLVKQYVNEIHMLIVEAKQLALTANKKISSSGTSSQVDSGNTTGQNVLMSSNVSQPPLIDSDNKPNLPTDNGVSVAVSHSVSSYGRVLVSGPAIIRANPTVSLFKIVEVGQPTDGQKKAEKIKASFQNPFQKFLPVKSRSETTEGHAVVGDLQSDEQTRRINQQWRQATQLQSSSTISEPTVSQKRSHTENGDTPEDLTPLRDKTTEKSAKKKRKRESGDSCSSMSHYNKDEEMSPSHDSVSQPGREFVPFNYSDVDYLTFLGDTQKDSREKAVVFNPYNSSKDSKSNGPRSKVHMKSGHRSLTFSSKKPSSQKQKWPRR